MITLIISLAIIGFIVYLLTNYIPMDPMYKTAIIVVSLIIVLVYVLRLLGFADLPLR
jgi:hypothetical protein